MRRKSLFFNKLVLPAVIIISVISVLFVFAALAFICRTAFISSQNLQKEIGGQLLRDVEARLGKLDDTAFVIMNEPRLITFFSERAADSQSGENYFDSDLVAQIQYATILATFNRSYPPIWRICVYNDKGDFVYTGTKCHGETVNSRLASMDVGQIMQDAALHPLEHSVLIYNRDVWGQSSGEGYITMRGPLMNIYSNRVYGVLELTIDSSDFDAVLKNYEQYGFNINIKDANGITVAESISDGTENLLASETKSEKYGWSFTVENSLADVVKPYLLLAVTVAAAGILIALTAVTFIYNAADKTLAPLAKLKDAVSRVSSSGYTPDGDDKDKIDEVKELDAAFSDMLSRLNNSLMLEKKATVLAMQSQMNPHFLFNMLSVIGAAGAENGCEKVQTLCRQLSEMLRYSASYKDSTVTMCQEVQHLTNYLKLMKARYEDFLNYRVDISEELYYLTVPKLFLQPIVENSFSHGFAGSEPPYELCVCGRAENGVWRIVITDNGAGFTEQQREFVVNRVKRLEDNVSENLSSTSIGGLGLASAVLRMRLISGKNIRFDIESNYPKGAKIILEGEM